MQHRYRKSRSWVAVTAAIFVGLCFTGTAKGAVTFDSLREFQIKFLNFRQAFLELRDLGVDFPAGQSSIDRRDREEWTYLDDWLASVLSLAGPGAATNVTLPIHDANQLLNFGFAVSNALRELRRLEVRHGDQEEAIRQRIETNGGWIRDYILINTQIVHNAYVCSIPAKSLGAHSHQH